MQQRRKKLHLLIVLSGNAVFGVNSIGTRKKRRTSLKHRPTITKIVPSLSIKYQQTLVNPNLSLRSKYFKKLARGIIVEALTQGDGAAAFALLVLAAVQVIGLLSLGPERVVVNMGELENFCRDLMVLPKSRPTSFGQTQRDFLHRVRLRRAQIQIRAISNRAGVIKHSTIINFTSYCRPARGCRSSS